MGYKVLAGRYEIHEKIGDGGMAVVYSARDKLLNRLVAIKILRPDFVKDANFVENFRRESRAAAGLNHPNIVSIFDVGKDGNIYYIVMELVRGRPLSDIIAERAPMPFREVISIGSQVASALAFAHKNNIIHRDVKPHNILITEDDFEMHAKITDFGIARAVTDRTTINDNNIVMGSVHYFSPEQGRGKYVDEKSDIYSLGIVLYEMTTGRVPFDANEPIAVALMHMNEPIVPPSHVVNGVPPGLEQIILRATQKVQVNRFANVEQMKEALDNVGRLINTFGDSYVTESPRNGAAYIPVIPPGYPDEAYAGEPGEYTNDNGYANDAYGNGEYANDPYNDDWDEDDEDEALADGRLTRDNASRPERGARKSGKAAASGKKVKDPAKKRKGKIKRWAILLAVIAALGLCYPLYKGVNWLLSERGVAVPDVVDLLEDEAYRKLADKDFKMELDEPQFSDTVGEGRVIEQTPEADKKAKKGSTVTVILSKGVDPETEQPADEGTSESEVPDLVGKSSESAKEAITKAGFEFGGAKSVDSNKAKGTVISQSPAAGEKLAAGGSISIEVSLGPEETEAVVPSLLGLTKNEAGNALTKAGLKLGGTSEEYSADYPAGEVMWQQYKKGVKLAKGKSIDVKFSKGPESKTSTVTISVDCASAPSATFNLSVLLVPDSGSQKYIIQNSPRSQANGVEEVPVTGTGKGKVNVYFNDKLYKQYTVDFNTGKIS
ncbi:MAG: Stk1 family PASTA domain-containing Ser/Thr kinase [Clostridiales Family XIII bacterium]|jgi:serine/threonine-protein kinase|nr:Stk1 family PASTA domain-containing Ser/Thr kinase [Clostridiales Family XIII bacterium]